MAIRAVKFCHESMKMIGSDNLTLVHTWAEVVPMSLGSESLLVDSAYSDIVCAYFNIFLLALLQS